MEKPTITIIELDAQSSGCVEDKYGYLALFKTLNDTYRCPCGNFYVYKDDEGSTLVCPTCGNEKILTSEEIAFRDKN
ncbi:MAG: hypothetical protein PHW52_04355 [Candidatus Pacebacteria bacterium]|nr:hypothetical protein [Candidatus Paceibacterota bacterium]